MQLDCACKCQYSSHFLSRSVKKEKASVLSFLCRKKQVSLIVSTLFIDLLFIFCTLRGSEITEKDLAVDILHYYIIAYYNCSLLISVNQTVKCSHVKMQLRFARVRELVAIC